MNDSLHYTPQSTPAQPGSAPDRRGLFIVLEGGDGAGKTTQLARLQAALEAQGYTVIATREPGGTPLGEALRELVLKHGSSEVDARAEALIFAASRAAHAAQKIRPALAAGAVVLSDRYLDSSAAYQGIGRNLGKDTITDLSRWATEDLIPHATILLDVPLTDESQRMSDRGTVDRIEAEGADFKARVHTAFADIARQNADGAHYVVDGCGSVDAVHERVLEVVRPLLESRELAHDNGDTDDNLTPSGFGEDAR